jgi:hypothetical protein
MPSLRLVDRSAVTREKPPHTFSLFNLTDGAGAALLPSVHPHFCFNHSPAGVRFAQKTAGNLVTGNPCNSFRINIHGVAPKVMILSNLEER